MKSVRITYTPIRRRRLHAVDMFLGVFLLGLLIAATTLLGMAP